MVSSSTVPAAAGGCAATGPATSAAAINVSAVIGFLMATHTLPQPAGCKRGEARGRILSRGPMPVDPLENLMKLKSGLVVMCLLALSSLVLAQSVDGTWTAEIQGGRGPQTLTITLKADAGKLTGSAGGGRGGPVDITDGTISGADLK